MNGVVVAQKDGSWRPVADILADPSLAPDSPEVRQAAFLQRHYDSALKPADMEAIIAALDAANTPIALNLRDRFMALSSQTTAPDRTVYRMYWETL